jgi:hypothetical protein
MIDIGTQGLASFRGTFVYLTIFIPLGDLPHQTPYPSQLLQTPPSANSIRNANDATSRPSTSIARLQTILVPTFPQIIRARMHDDGAAQHGLLADQLDEAVLDAALAVAVGVGLEIAEVADVAHFVTGGTV